LALTPEQAAHVGDDVLDLPILTQVGFAVAVNDAHFAVKRYADWCTETAGGQGAVREVCDAILQVQGHFEAVLAEYLCP
jgi:3-deoxy-D-manno-octulosonate 8-phosphate phosphatase (KDO 8-P phosphatase)